MPIEQQLVLRRIWHIRPATPALGKLLLIAGLVAFDAHTLMAQVTPPVTPPMAPPAVPPTRRRGPAETVGERDVGMHALAAAAVGAVTGGVFGLLAPSDCCMPSGWSRSQTTALWAGAGAGSGAIIGFVVGTLGREPLSEWQSGLAGGAIGATVGALGGVMGGATGGATSHYAVFGGVTGALAGATVGLLSERHAVVVVMRGDLAVRPTASGIMVRWSGPMGW